MRKQSVYRKCLFGLAAVVWLGCARSAVPQTDTMRLKVEVVLVELDVAVTDSKGKYVSGLKPENFVITEDNLPETIQTFEEGNEPRVAVHAAPGSTLPGGVANVSATTATGTGTGTASHRSTDSNVFILFDTSNYMYRGFVYAQDAIADFVRSLEGVDGLALYSYSRDLSRIAPLSEDRSLVLHGLRQTVAGDYPALYNSLLTTVKDAAPLSGRKAVVVFSNGPDTASVVPPEDVSEFAQSTGTIIYMISTRAAQSEPVSSAVFERMTRATGGTVYFAKEWQDENKAFAAIRDDLAHLYTLSYSPQINQNRGFRHISVKLVGSNAQKYHVRTREGYRLLHPSEVAAATPMPAATAKLP